MRNEKGKKNKEPQASVIAKLIEVWEEGTAKKAKLGRNTAGDYAVGPFVGFLQDCFNLGGIRYISNQALAQDAKRTLKKRKTN